MSFKFHWGGQVSADIQAQNQMLYDAMPEEQQKRVAIAELVRSAEWAWEEIQQAKLRDSGWERWLRRLQGLPPISEVERQFEQLCANIFEQAKAPKP